MTSTPTTIETFLAGVSAFARLPDTLRTTLAGHCQFLRYRVGQTILVQDALPAQVSIIYEGRVRLLGLDPRTQTPVTVELLEAGGLLGAVGLLRDVPCELAIASTEVTCLNLPSLIFLRLFEQPEFIESFRDRCGLIEAFDLLGRDLARKADSSTNLKALALELSSQAIVRYLTPNAPPLEGDRLWLVSSAGHPLPVGSALIDQVMPGGSKPVRVVGFPQAPLDAPTMIDPEPAIVPEVLSAEEIPYAPARPATLDREAAAETYNYPHVRARGPIEGTLACFQMLSQHLGLPFRRDVVRRVLNNQSERMGGVSLPVCGAIAEMIGLNSQLVNVPANSISQIPAPALIAWQDSFAILYKVTEREVVLGSPETGILRRKPDYFSHDWRESAEVLLLQASKETPKQRFGLSWFWPSVQKHRRVLIEVLVASFFVQLFGLANPLITQLIIDKVLVQNSVNTLNTLGILLVVVAVFEALLSSLRTYLFVDTTNRIDMTLGSQVIDHLLRLPLRYFEKRPVGELSTRINELENIRNFLTGTALTVVLDAVFSVIYIVVMIIYSWLLTIIALITVPLFALLTFIVAPIVRQQTRDKAERNAETQSYLVEVVSGIQTVKSQNIELNARWRWQDRYARYVNAGFKTVLTSTTAGSMSNFLNKLSGLLLLWVGAYLVLAGQLTLGQLIAFRIIAGYTTSPLLRLIQLWQNFQETALSLERLSDIIDSPQEIEMAGRDNIPMPVIRGAVTYERACFRFTPNGPLQLSNVSLEIPAGHFVGVVGQSGSGKSTLMKMLLKLYDLESGRVLIDGYDISKVELYSVRSQVGVVLQDTLLFQGTVQDNIGLTNPDASQEAIIEAAKVAYAHDFIMTLPQGYNTQVGERGANLSGGQRQRLAIARTVLQNPNLLILDEATSALDYLAERQVCNNLREAFKGRTVFFITHRLPSIAQSDTIIMMDQGLVAEQGTHTELMTLRGQYYALYQQQASQSDL
ncbi:MAG: peptidase domain-containing ABC transporter [Aphanocapsa sp. GSE-SYN-MK-11-07L]|jgi:ATP-binding cassette subfamily B protein|nr:peptidase domain-containing ABC transporter [Aphanocapsa sp. GSE-SYN-MK-11-07L]